MPNATNATPMKDRCGQCPAHAHQHPLGGMGTVPAWVTLQLCHRFHTVVGKGGQGWGQH